MQVFLIYGPTVSATAGTTSAATALNLQGAEPGDDSVRVYNSGTAPVFIEFGPSSEVTAALATSLPVAPGSVEVFRIPARTTHVATIMASGAATVYFTLGSGA